MADTEQHISTIVTDLISYLGAMTVSRISYAADEATINRWARGETTPVAMTQKDLRTMHQVWHRIATADDEISARMFMTSPSRRLEGKTPIDALRRGDYDQVRGAVDEYLENREALTDAYKKLL